MSLVTYGNAFDAFALLYSTQAETSRKLEVESGAHTLSFEYELQ